MEGKKEGGGGEKRGRGHESATQEVSKRLVRNGMKTQVSMRGDFYSH